MQIGMIGLGRMGANMVRRLLRGGHECVVNDRNPEAVKTLVNEGAIGAAVARRFYCEAQAAARDLVDDTRRRLLTRFSISLLTVVEAGDMIIDGGNSYYIDDIRRAQELQSQRYSLR